MRWRHLPVALCLISATFVVLGLVELYRPDDSWAFERSPELPMQFVALGMLGIGFVAWLKR